MYKTAFCLLAVGAVLSSAAAQLEPIAADEQSLPREVPDDPPILRPRHDGPRQMAAGNAFVESGPWISRQVNINALGFNIPGDAANEPSIAIDPANPDVAVIGWRQFDTIDSNFRQAGYGFSHDGGLNWTFPGVLEPGVFRSDPVLDSDLDGNIYYYSLTGDFFCWTFISGDGGVNWSGPFSALGGDKAWFMVDKTTSTGQGHVYAAWSTAGNNFFPNQFTRSVDGGFTYEGPFTLVPDSPRPIWGTLTTDEDGILYVSGQRDGDIYVVKSLTARLAGLTPTFEPRVQVDMGGVFTTGFDPNPNPGGLLGQVWIAAGRSGGATDNIYLFTSIDPPGSDPMDVHFSRSEDGGQTWSAPVRVNDDASDPDHWQWFGTMSVAPNGRIDTIWNDTRGASVHNISELFYAYSTDDGHTWSPNIQVSHSFDSHLGWPQQNKLGDYYDMISENTEARIAYAATFNGEQDVYYLEVGDCNENGVHDGTDISSGSSTDFNADGIPDDCQCLSDINGDGVVDVVDFLELLAVWGPCPGCPADINRDGEVNVVDFLILLADWGACP
ncbi:MAG: dockerin type I domain-containing protein [Planctomycetota bacterium]|jgi:hypothetical protein